MEAKVKNVLFDFYNRAISVDRQNEFTRKIQDRSYLNLLGYMVSKLEGVSPSQEWILEQFSSLDVEALSYVDSEGIIAYSTDPELVGVDINQDPIRREYRFGLETEDYTLATDLFDEETTKKEFVRSVPEQGGILIITIFPDILEILTNATNRETLIRGLKVDDFAGFGMVINMEGVIEIHPNPDYLGMTLSDLGIADQVIGKSQGEVYYNYKGVDNYVAFRQGGGYIYGINVEVAPYYKPIYDTLLIQIGSALIGLIFLGIASWFIIQLAVLKPLKNVTLRVWEISKGGGDLTQRISHRNRDELGDLADGFNSFLDTLSQIISKITYSSQETVTIKDSLTASSEETAATIRQISVNITSIRDQISFLDNHISNTAGKSQAIQSETESLEEELENQTSSTEQASAAINEMVASLNNVAAITRGKKEATRKLTETTTLGGERLSGMIKEVHEIHENLGSISNMVGLINSIAAQTNLLAMNAAIEAAHAGDAGRGFAVVADEIRKLAENSGSNAKSISRELKDIANRIVSAAESSESTREAFTEIQKEVQGVDQALSEITSATEELNVGGQEIITAMDVLSKVSSKVTEATKLITVETKEIGTSMQDINRISEEVNGAMAEIKEGADEIGDGVEHLNSLSLSLQTTADSLQDQVGQFTIEAEEA